MPSSASRISKMTIRYLVGDATNPEPIDPTKKQVILHCCNNVGAWGAGFVLALSEKWPEPEKKYRAWSERNKDCCQGRMPLGEVQFVDVSEDITVVNIIGQCGVGPDHLRRPPIRYDAVSKGLWYTAGYFRPSTHEINLPKMGTGLAGGDWIIIERLLELHLVSKGYSVTVYTLEG